MRAGWLLVGVLGCATTHVQYPGGNARPKLLATQMYTASLFNPRDGREVHRYLESILIEAGCVRAAHQAGIDLTVQHSKASVETDADLSFVHGSVDAAKVAASSGADAVLTGTAHLSKRLEVEKLRLEVRSPQNSLLASAEMASDDGVEPMQAGEQLCSELFRGWVPGPPRPAVTSAPRKVFLVGVPRDDRGERFRRGCEQAAGESGVAVVPTEPLLAGPGTRWLRWALSTGAEGFLVADLAVPTGQPEGIGAAHVWLTDVHGVVLGTRLYRAQGAGAVGEPSMIGHELCRSVFTP